MFEYEKPKWKETGTLYLDINKAHYFCYFNVEHSDNSKFNGFLLIVHCALFLAELEEEVDRLSLSDINWGMHVCRLYLEVS